MAERRMISKKITDTDAFLDMPLSTQALYFHLIQNADDEGFVGNPKTIARKIGANQNDLDLLIAKRFVLTFDASFVVVIKHWFIHNYIAKDRRSETTYIDEKSQLQLKENRSYTKYIQNVYNLDTQYSIDKNSIDEYSKEESIKKKGASTTHTFVKPTLEEVKAYCEERHNSVNAERFVDFYESKGWMVGKNKMKNWKACVRTWEQRDKQQPSSCDFNVSDKHYSEEELEANMSSLEDLEELVNGV